MTGTSLRYVVGRTWEAGNVAFYSPDRPSVFIDGDLRRSPWIDPEAVAYSGAVLVWDADREGEIIPPWLHTLYPTAQPEPPLLLQEQITKHLFSWAPLAPPETARAQ
jgi:hypothetical protein